jgi:hypothetical protein
VVALRHHLKTKKETIIMKDTNDKKRESFAKSADLHIASSPHARREKVSSNSTKASKGSKNPRHSKPQDTSAPRETWASAKIDTAVRLAIRNIIKEGVSDVLPNPFEVELLTADRKLQVQTANRATQIIERGCFTAVDFHKLEFIEVPKRKYEDRRVCAVIDPHDSIVYLALAIMAAPSIKQHRKPAREQSVFSYHFAPRNGKLFDSRYCYASFMEALQSRLTNHGFIVKCDVKNFYQGVTPALVRESLNHCHVTPFVSDYVTDLLSFWSQSGLQGLPVGYNASRILAESVFIPIDEALNAQGIYSIRFADDLYLFTDSDERAQKALETLSKLLAVSKLDLNLEKTRIFQVPEVLHNVGLQAPHQNSGEPQDESYGEAKTFNGYQSCQKHFRPATSQEIARMCALGDLPEPSIFLNGTLAPRWYVRQSLRPALYLTHLPFIKAIPI